MAPSLGDLVLVVGPSGAGKDTVLAGARVALRHDPWFVFPRREITRPADAGGEDHVAVSDADFAAVLQSDGYALGWQAHGLRYGIPRAIDRDLEAGRTVTVNASRQIVGEARQRYDGTQVVHVTAAAEILAERLAARGREGFDDIRSRLARRPEMPSGDGVWQIANDGPPEAAIDRLISILRVIDARSRLLSEATAGHLPEPPLPAASLD